MKLHYLFPNTLTLAALVTLSAVSVADDASNPSDGPWISDVAWQGNDHVLGTRSQGLLFRTAEIVKAPASNPDQLEVVGESESSLWSLLALDGGKIVASDYKGGVHLFGDGEPKSFTSEARWIRTLSATPQQGELLAGTEDGKLLVLSVDQAKEARRIDAHKAAIFDIAVSAAGDKVATASGDGSIKIFSWPELEILAEMSIAKEAVWSLLFVNDDQQLVSGGADRAIQLWDVASAKSIVTMATAHNWVTSLIAIPKTHLVVAGCMDGSLLVVDHKTMRVVTTQAGPGSAIWSLALSPDSKRVAIGTRKHGIAVVSVAPWRKAGRAAAAESNAIRPPSPKR